MGVVEEVEVMGVLCGFYDSYGLENGSSRLWFCPWGGCFFCLPGDRQGSLATVVAYFLPGCRPSSSMALPLSPELSCCRRVCAGGHTVLVDLDRSWCPMLCGGTIRLTADAMRL